MNTFTMNVFIFIIPTKNAGINILVNVFNNYFLEK